MYKRIFFVSAMAAAFSMVGCDTDSSTSPNLSEPVKTSSSSSAGSVFNANSSSSLVAVGSSSSANTAVQPVGDYVVEQPFTYSVVGDTMQFRLNLCEEVGGELVWEEWGKAQGVPYTYNESTGMVQFPFVDSTLVFHAADYAYSGSSFPVGTWKEVGDVSVGQGILFENNSKGVFVHFIDTSCPVGTALAIAGTTGLEDMEVTPMDCQTIQVDWMTFKLLSMNSEFMDIAYSYKDVSCPVHLVNRPLTDKSACEAGYEEYREDLENGDVDGPFDYSDYSSTGEPDLVCMLTLYTTWAKDNRLSLYKESPSADTLAVRQLLRKTRRLFR